MPRRTSGSLPIGGGVYKVGKPYMIRGQMYYPSEDPSYDRTGLASFYDRGFHGGRTANGEVFDTSRLNAAHPTMPMPSYARVTNLENGRTILVRVNNRGPYAPGRIIDLSRRSAEILGFSHRGLARVRVTYAGRAPMDGSDHAERAFLARQPWYNAQAAVR